MEYGREAGQSEVRTVDTAGIPGMLLTQHSTQLLTFSYSPSGTEEALTPRTGQAWSDSCQPHPSHRSPHWSSVTRNPRSNKRFWTPAPMMQSHRPGRRQEAAPLTAAFKHSKEWTTVPLPML